jgi:hypothetical protein
MEPSYCGNCGRPVDDDRTTCANCDARVKCANCRASLPAGNRFCPNCGARATLGSRTLARRRIMVPTALGTSGWLAVLVVLLVVAGGPSISSHSPRPEGVLTSDGTWTYSDTEYAGVATCQNCGAGVVTPGSVFAITIQVTDPVASNCDIGEGDFRCFAINAFGFQVDAPYTLVAEPGGQLPVTICTGGEYNWTFSIQAPSTAGDDPINGVFDGGPVLQQFHPLNCVLSN